MMSEKVIVQGSLWYPIGKSFRQHNEDFGYASLEIHRNSQKCGKRWSVSEIKIKISHTGEQWRSSSLVNKMIYTEKELLY